MTIGELKRILGAFDDSDQILVEAPTGGFEEPKIYVCAIRQRRGDEFQNPFASEYVSAGVEAASGKMVIGSSLGLLMCSF